MRIAGIIRNTAAEVEWWQHTEIIRECEQRRQEWEARFGPRSGCPWGCDGSGWREVAFDEMYFDHPAFAVVLPHGLLLFPCECNSNANIIQMNWKGGGNVPRESA